jgi:D-serine deaminase-like pyridoxal phosphate-dependent protein
MVELPVPLRAGTELPVDVNASVLDTPAILVDLDTVDINIRHMAGVAERNGFKLRPHVKTHKSVAMARRQIAAGAVGVCAATVSEAEAMIAGGLRDVLIAYPLIGARKFERLTPLFERAKITLAADSVAVIRNYAEFATAIGQDVSVMLEIDSGMHRVGVAPEDAVALGAHIRGAGRLSFGGIMTHAGHTHDATTAVEVEAIARREAELMGMVREDLERVGFDVPVVSAGSTITAPYFRPGDAVTEIRPGTYIYNDLRTLALFACTPDVLAASALTTIVSIDGNRLTVDAGSKTLTVSKDEAFGLGFLAECNEARIARLSEEHGVINAPEAERRFAVGQRVQVVPVHVCVWMDLQAEIYGVRSGRIVERIAIDAMRHSL